MRSGVPIYLGMTQRPRMGGKCSIIACAFYQTLTNTMGMPGVIKAMALGIQAQVAKVVSSWRKDDLFGADILAAYDKLADKAKGDRGQQPLPAHGSPVTGGDSNISLPSAGSMEGAFLHHPPRSTPYPVVFRIALKVVLAFAWCVFISSREARP